MAVGRQTDRIIPCRQHDQLQLYFVYLAIQDPSLVSRLLAKNTY